MNFFISARTAQREIVQEMIEVLEAKGHTCTHNWTQTEGLAIKRPFQPHAKQVQKFAEDDLNGAKESDVLIILGDAGGTGIYVEMGAALANGAKVYAVGEHNDATIFYFHPNVSRVGSFEAVLKDLPC